MSRRVLGVGQLLDEARGVLDEGLGGVWVEGEVFEYRGAHSASGHRYFKLRDGEGTVSVILWRWQAERALHCELQEGMKVLVHGRFDIYTQRGTLSFLLDHVEPLGGVGDLARRFEELKKRLLAEGLFDPSRKRALPERPRRVVLITGRDSAAEADLLRGLSPAGAPLQVLLRHAPVQGKGAAEELVRALAEAASVRPDLILLARGGGSLEDLWSFNEEVLVRAVSASPVPVLCAVGHETDTSLCDYAADARAMTPTAAAVQVAESWRVARETVADLGAALEDAAVEHCALRRRALDRALRAYLSQAPALRLQRARAAVGSAEQRFLHAGARGPARARRAALAMASRLERAGPLRRTERARATLEGLRARLESANPLGLLDRGYAVVSRKGEDAYLRDAADVAAGDLLQVRLARGSVDARVE